MATASETIEPDLSGQILDRYQLLRRLGIGGMGAVYEAEHTKLEKRVAVKLLRHEFTMQEIARKRFLREAKAATKVKHPNVVDISDFGETPEGRVYFVMELLAGQDLSDLIKKEQRLPWERAKVMLLQVASALEAAHVQGIVHRDMKPSNCFLVDVPGMGDFIKVLDFGIAKFSGGGHEELTSTDEIFGTVAYMAPEMVQGITNDTRSDIYATGVMMYRMLTGSLPFGEGNAFQILTQHINATPPLPREKEPSISEGIEAVILKALKKDVSHRFQTMGEFAEAIRLGYVPENSATVAHSRVADPEVGATEVLSAFHGDAPSGRVAAVEATVAVAGLGSAPTGPHTAGGESTASTGSAAAASTGPMANPTGPMTGPMTNPLMAAEPGTGSMSFPVQGKGRALPIAVLLVLIAGVFVGAVALGIYIARGQDSEAPVVAAVSSPTELDPKPKVEPESINAPVDTIAEPKDETDPSSKEPSTSGGVEVVPGPEDEVEPTTIAKSQEGESSEGEQNEPAPKTKVSPRKKKKTDAEVIAGLKRKMKKLCFEDGSITVRLEAQIKTSGKVLGAIATPRTGPGVCAKKLLRSAGFAPQRDGRMMPIFSVDL